MTVTVSVNIECEWCHVRTGPHHSLHFEPEDARRIADLWLADQKGRPWVLLDGPPGTEWHLCAACAADGPPRRLPSPSKRKRRPVPPRLPFEMEKLP